MNNRIHSLFRQHKQPVLSVYFTAGFPERDQTVSIIQQLESAGVDCIEIGIPFSDPLADGPTIQESSQIALSKGMNLPLLLEQLQDIRANVSIPLILMGYWNPILQFGVRQFITQCARIGIDGVIIPDLPVDLYVRDYKALFEAHNLSFIPLITPSSTDERIQAINRHTNGFIYMVSTYGTTGATANLQTQQAYFERVRALGLDNPLVIGFGIQNQEDIHYASRYADGVIVGSAFIRHLRNDPEGLQISTFIQHLKPVL